MYLFAQSDFDAFNTILESFLKGVPGFFMALVITIVGFIISKIISRIVTKALQAIKIDTLGEKLNEIDFIDKSNISIKVSTIVGKVIYYFVLLIFLTMATDKLGMPAVSELVAGALRMIPQLFVAFIVLIVGILLADGLKGVVQTALDSLGIPSSRMIAMAMFYFLLINIFISALSIAEINTEFLSQNISIVIGGIVLAFAIGYGLASKSSMSNFLSSYYSQGKFGIGDTITIDGVSGKIVEMDRSSLILVAENGNKIVFPLSHVSNTRIEIHN